MIFLEINTLELNLKIEGEMLLYLYDHNIVLSRISTKIIIQILRSQALNSATLKGHLEEELDRSIVEHRGLRVRFISRIEV